MKVTSHEKNSTGDSSQASLGFLRSRCLLIVVYVTVDQMAVLFGTDCV